MEQYEVYAGEDMMDYIDSLISDVYHCDRCAGSGEGDADGLICGKCNGKGEYFK